MNENKINPLLDVMSEIDDSIITNTASTPKKSKKRPLLIAIAAAAAVTLLIGCVQAYRSSVRVGGNIVFDIDYHMQEGLNLLTHEELIEMGAECISENEPSATGGYYTIMALPSEVFSAFNINTLINDNFIEELGIDVDYMWGTPYPSEPKHVNMYYYLTDKESRIRVRFYIGFPLIEQYSTGRHFSKLYADEYIYFDLNDGSKAIAWDANAHHNEPSYNPARWTVYFAYNGMSYDLYFEDTDIDGVTQILSDLGVL